MPLFKYEKEQKLLKNCPPARFKNLHFEAFRLVKNSPPTARDFIPCAISQPTRKFFNCEQECSALGLSFFTTSDELERTFGRLRRNMKNFSKIFGDKIAKGQIKSSHGVSSVPNSDGHFTLHEYDSCALETEFVIIKPFDAELKAG